MSIERRNIDVTGGGSLPLGVRVAHPSSFAFHNFLFILTLLLLATMPYRSNAAGINTWNSNTTSLSRSKSDTMDSNSISATTTLSLLPTLSDSFTGNMTPGLTPTRFTASTTVSESLTANLSRPLSFTSTLPLDKTGTFTDLPTQTHARSSSGAVLSATHHQYTPTAVVQPPTPAPVYFTQSAVIALRLRGSLFLTLLQGETRRRRQSAVAGTPLAVALAADLVAVLESPPMNAVTATAGVASSAFEDDAGEVWIPVVSTVYSVVEKNATNSGAAFAALLLDASSSDDGTTPAWLANVQRLHVAPIEVIGVSYLGPTYTPNGTGNATNAPNPPKESRTSSCAAGCVAAVVAVVVLVVLLVASAVWIFFRRRRKAEAQLEKLAEEGRIGGNPHEPISYDRSAKDTLAPQHHHHHPTAHTPLSRTARAIQLAMVVPSGSSPQPRQGAHREDIAAIPFAVLEAQQNRYHQSVEMTDAVDSPREDSQDTSRSSRFRSKLRSPGLRQVGDETTIV